MKISRRSFLGSAAAAAALPVNLLEAQAPESLRGNRLRVQYTTGGHTVPLSSFVMFTDDTFGDLDTIAFPHPNAFRNLLGQPGEPGPDVLVLYDYLTESFDEQDQQAIRNYLNAGKGLVVLHHALCDNQRWAWWREEVTGGSLIQLGIDGIKRGRLKQFPVQQLSPVGEHPIVRDLQPFLLPRDEIFIDMWLSPKVTPLLESDDADLSNKTLAWVGVHPKARVASMQPGHTPQVCAHPRYMEIVHRMVLWTGRRL